MNEDDLKRCTVQIATGSGCLIQSLSSEYTYVLTSRHLFCNQQHIDGITNFIERDDGQEASIKYYIHNGNEWKMQKHELTLTRGENYFSHNNPQVDAAILKVPHIKNYNQAIVCSDRNTPDGFRLCGHPSNRRNQADPYTSYIIQGNIASTNFGQTAQLDLGNVTQDHIEGMSGGGILKPDRSCILIAGIQSKMLSVILPAGQVAFVPIKYYAEVVESFPSQLEKLPSYNTPTYIDSRIVEFEKLKTVILGNRKFSVFCIALFFCTFLASVVSCIFGSGSYTILATTIAAITFMLSFMSFFQLRGYKAKIIAHDVYVNRYEHAPPPPHDEIEDKIIDNAKIGFL